MPHSPLPEKQAHRRWRLASRLATADPGLIRLRLASRVTLTVVLCAAALALSHQLAPLPPAAYAVALTLAIQGAVAIRDATHRHRLATRVVCGLAGFAMLAVVSMIASEVVLVDLVFLGVAFAAVFARRWGARWNAVGMFSFMSCFIAAYFRPSPADLGAIAFALALSGLIADVVRDRLVPDRPAADLRRTLEAVDQRIAAVVSILRRAHRSGWTGDLRDAALAGEQRVKDALITAEGQLPAPTGGSQAPPDAATQLSIELFDLHLAAETALAAGLGGAPGDEAASARLMAALDRLARMRLAARQTAAGLTDEILDRAVAATPPGAAGAALPVWQDPTFRLAAQVTLACAIAMVGGSLVSEQRWFWAVLTAFLVFTNTQSRGDAALRGVARAVGTAGGIVVGIGLATLVHGQFALSLGFIAAFVFLAFYTLQLSYGALTFFMTLGLSLLYGLLGSFSPGLLVLRLEETLIGAAAGVGVAYFVFPQRTEAASGKAADAFLAELDRLLAAFADRRRGEGSAWRLVAVTQALDRRHAEIVAALRPLDSGWLAGERRRMVRRGQLRFTVLAYWAHRLAGASEGVMPIGSEDETDATLNACRAEIAELRRRRSDIFHEAQTVSLVPPDAASARADPAEPDAAIAIHAIRHILNQVMGSRTGSAEEAKPNVESALSTKTDPSDKQPARFAG
ncbi:FUSC family protein [Aureimonas pseudogalii]|uniref:Putative membrane protein YccC n=1 Tax=Aureimonas pseudogalii TaxID=1744844 RepID=A0A7W6H5P6_9HYPH|nr:FUSC family protein [Aureimonas pseudogalii]MBB3999004.1 putative membrane protein YccC [Aureimonas pseudogalii]